MPKSPPCPALSSELIDYLEALYPSRCPSLDENERTIFYKAGQAAVVSFLRGEFTYQQTSASRLTADVEIAL